ARPSARHREGLADFWPLVSRWRVRCLLRSRADGATTADRGGRRIAVSDERCPWCGEPYHTEEDGSTVYYSQHDPEECRDTLHRKLAAKNQELQAAFDVIEAAREVVEAARELCLNMLDMGLHGEAKIELFEALEAAIDRYDALRGA